MKINKNTWHAGLFHQAYVLNRTWLSFMVWLYSFGLLMIRGRNKRDGGSELFYFKRARQLGREVQLQEKELVEDYRKYAIPSLDDFQEKFFKKVLRIQGSSVQHAMENGSVSLCRYFWSVVAACTIYQLFQLLTSNQLIAKTLVKKLKKLLIWLTTIDHPFTREYDRERHQAFRLHYPGVSSRMFWGYPPVTHSEMDVIIKQIRTSGNKRESFIISTMAPVAICAGICATYMCARVIAASVAMLASASGIMPEYPEFQRHKEAAMVIAGLLFGGGAFIALITYLVHETKTFVVIEKILDKAFGIMGDMIKPAQVRLLNATSATIGICTRLVRDQKTKKALNDTAHLLTEYALAVKQRVCPLITFSDQL